MKDTFRALPLVFLGGLALTVLGLTADSQDGGSPVPQTVATPMISTADSNGQMIAVTGMDVTGSSILFLVDTENRQLAVYQAQGGSESTSSVRLVGARNIDLDLQLDGYNDRSEYSYKELAAKFAELAEED